MKLKKLLNKYDWTCLIPYILYAICILFIIWVIASWVNINQHNLTDCVYWKYNFFTLFWR